MANGGIRLDLQRALAEGAEGIPNLEPLFAPGAIPPIFDEAPDVGFSDVGVNPETGQGTFTGEPIDLGGGSIGQPVPPVKQSRGHKIRALLANYLQSFGTGLEAAASAPSGSEFAAGFGAALSASEERRQQKAREDLLRANQAVREQFAKERAELDAERFEFDKRQAETARIKSDLALAGAERKTFQDILAAGTRRASDIQRRRKERAEDIAFAREEGESEFLRRLRLKRTPSGGKSGTTKFPEVERKRLAEAIALQLGLEVPKTGITGKLDASGSFLFRLKLSRIGTKIDRIVRAGGDPEEVFGLAVDAVRQSGKPVNLENVLAVISDRPRR